MQRFVRALGYGALALALVAAVPLASAAGDPATGGLGARGNMLLKKARSEGAATVTLIVASKPGQNSAVAKGVAALGGTVRYREDDLDYLRVVIATDKVKAVSALPGVQAVDISETLPLPDPRPEGSRGTVPQPAPSSSTPRANPYMPIEDIKAASFLAAHSSWDGRGVTIGILDSGVSLDHPSLLTTSTGERKVIDWVTYTDPFDDDDPTWVNMADQVSGAQFTYKAVTYTAPYAGSFRIGLFNERDPRFGNATNSEIAGDVNRDGNPAGSSGIFAVLWDTATNRVWVDTNQNRSFADEIAMRDYKVAYDVNWFGTDNPATPVAERMPFVVQTDGKNKVVNIGIISGAHGSHVTGIAAGNALFGGAMSGAAPGAKVVSVRVCLFIAGCTAHGLVEGMIYAAKQSNVDVINMSIGGLPSLNDGNNALTVLYDRLIEKYNVQMFISAGNSGPGMNTVGDPSVASRVMSVGAYVSRDGLQFNYGAVIPGDAVPYADNLNYFSSPGPREDGGFKPQLVASGHAISTTPLWQPGSGLPYTLPPGYSLFNGTSMASPQAAGGAALLISAAKQSGVQKQPAQLRQALNSSTRLLDGPSHANIPIYAQGNGLLDVVAAWDLLRTNIKTSEFVGTVPVNSVLSAFLATPGIGTGIYEREGLGVGESIVRTYTFTRTKGGSKPVSYNVSWVGDDNNTFSSPGTIALPLNTPVTLPVTINASTAGAHSAILNLDDPSTVGIDYQTMNVAVASETFTPANGYSVTKTGSIGRAQQQRFFFDVRAEVPVPAFKVDFSGPSSAPGTGQARFLRWHPYGVGIDSNAVSNCYVGSACTTGSPLSRTTTNPLGGVWEVTVDARRTSDLDLAPYTMTASILGATVSPNPDVIPSATIGVPVARSYTITNLFGAFTGRAVGTTLGSAFRATPTIANLGQQQFPVVVSAGSTSLRATIGGPSDPSADLDLYVFNCTAGPCVLAGQNADGDSEESVTIANPAAGNWVILVDGFAVPAGSTTYNYVDVFVNPAFGSVSVTDANALRPSGSSWVVPGSVTANAAPAAGRVLLGAVQVRTDTNILVGSGDVVVQAVAP